MIIIHGENTVASRSKLLEYIDQAKASEQEIVRVEAKALGEAELEELLGTSDLFGTEKTIIIEGLHSLPKSKKQKRLIELLANNQIHSLILWEKRALTKTMLKAFPNAKNFEFKVSKTLFTWLDMLGQKGSETKKLTVLHDAIKTDGEYFCFLMLIRQSRMLIQVKSGGKIAGAPFMIAKLKKQADQFTLESLRALHKKLLEIDQQQKTSTASLTLNQQLDLLTLTL